MIYFICIFSYSDIFVRWENYTNNDTIQFSSSFDSNAKSIDLGLEMNIGFKDLNFENKNGFNKGSAIRVPRPTVFYHINNTNFKKNTNSKEGGAIFMDVMHDVIIDNCTFEDHYSDSNGGSSFIISDRFLQVSFSKSINSKSNSSGGFGYFYTSSSNLSNNVFEDSNSTNRGGSIYLQGSSSNSHNIYYCLFGERSEERRVGKECS